MLQFKEEIKEIPCCPPVTAVGRTQTVWRWVMDPLTTDSFLPVALKNPPRLHDVKDAQEKCSCWGLSMHGSYEQSIGAFKHLERSFKMARKRIANSVASATITPDHGLCTDLDKYGHFDLHPYATAQLHQTFVIAGLIP